MLNQLQLARQGNWKCPSLGVGISKSDPSRVIPGESAGEDLLPALLLPAEVYAITLLAVGILLPALAAIACCWETRCARLGSSFRSIQACSQLGVLAVCILLMGAESGPAGQACAAAGGEVARFGKIDNVDVELSVLSAGALLAVISIDMCMAIWRLGGNSGKSTAVKQVESKVADAPLPKSNLATAV
jgi:hypothetical protein